MPRASGATRGCCTKPVTPSRRWSRSTCSRILRTSRWSPRSTAGGRGCGSRSPDGCSRRCRRTTTIRTAPARGGRTSSSTTRPISTSMGEIPDDLAGVYLRNTENPVHDVDRPLPPVRRRRHAAHDPLPRRPGRLPQPVRAHRRASPPSRTAGDALWSGILGAPEQSLRDDGWGARTRMKDASSTDVVVHAGRALTSFYQCGDLYALDPVTLEQLGRETLERPVPDRLGHLRAHEGRRAHRRDARVQLREDRAVHALRRRRRARRARPLRRRAAARPAPAARHGVHRALRDPQRLPAVLGRRPARPGRCTCRASAPTCRRASR